MKTDKKNIEQELMEQNASFLLDYKKKETKKAIDLEESKAKILSEIGKPASLIRKIAVSISAMAALVIIGLFLLNPADATDSDTELAISDLSQDDILLYLENEIDYLSEDEILAYLEIEETMNLFDNSGISNSDLENYIINELNEETQLEDLL